MRYVPVLSIDQVLSTSRPLGGDTATAVAARRGEEVEVDPWEDSVASLREMLV